MKLRFNGDLALVLGGSSDLALALANSMFETDITPILAFRNERGKKKIEKALSPVSSRFKTVFLDFSDRRTLENLSAEILGEPDFLVDFAQSDYERLVASAKIEDIYAYFEVNIFFRSVVLNRVSRMMLKRRNGRCVFVSSSAAAMPNPGQGFYAASKLASEALYRNLGLELGERGITSVVLRPGYVNSGRGKRYLKTEQQNEFLKIPTKHVLSPEEISETILFFLSESALGFNATEICMDGGLTAGKQYEKKKSREQAGKSYGEPFIGYS